ncbi:DUF6416 domain-containing protein [Amycolatopsis azurea]|uniref:Uncharacterized protein n=1 Tax=Amycolatopsis azurea DSM 43854 TaxID=1238180 RepID=M2QW87_9PSEU|nr:DUF6416 domain-containing protein [Amycolatopsis azurea]EMD30232.1 hypothetical protein C791_0218 [Amycolatopsis azurea DSM 43854]OOC07099.1 hypothetical protein B0293_08505 [Amycolatopsis azurea DSM 43854]
MIDVTVKVPEDRIPEFYSMFGRWLADPAAFEVLPTEETEVDLVEWSRSDGDLAKVVWGKFSDKAKALFSTLMDKPGARFSGDELGRLLGLPNGKHGVAGVLGWPGRHCQAVGRTWPWAWEYPEGENARYWMTDEVAALFRRARAN